MVPTASANSSPPCTSASARRSSAGSWSARLRRLAVCLGLLALAGGSAATRAEASQAATLDRILAIVAGHVILQSDVRAFVELGLVEAANGGDNPEDAVLTWLIERRLVLDEVQRYVAAEPPPAEVERRLAAVAARFPDAAAFAAVLARVGYSADDLRQVLRDDLQREAYVESRFGAAPAPGEASRRAELISEWVAGLVRRGQVSRP